MSGSASNATPPHNAPHAGQYQLRIIGGQWRGTKLNFPKVAAIRPTPDRVRETLFNWLQADVVGSRCLDLFAGSGALGMEALSRGAASATFVDQTPTITRYLRDTLTRLHCTNGDVLQGDALKLLPTLAGPFHLVFLDPPFAAAADTPLLTQLFTALTHSGLLSERAWVYLECPSALGSPDTVAGWPATWQLHRSKTAGQVGYHLIRSTQINSTESPASL